MPLWISVYFCVYLCVDGVAVCVCVCCARQRAVCVFVPLSLCVRVREGACVSVYLCMPLYTSVYLCGCVRVGVWCERGIPMASTMYTHCAHWGRLYLKITGTGEIPLYWCLWLIIEAQRHIPVSER